MKSEGNPRAVLKVECTWLHCIFVEPYKCRAMLKKIGLLIFGLIILLIIAVIGIPTDLISDEISPADVAKCEEFANIIVKNQTQINKDVLAHADTGDCLRYIIANEGDLNKLFGNIPKSENKKLADLVRSKFCEQIEVSEAKDCIKFQVKTSFHGLFFIGAYRQLYLIYENKPKCNCKDNPAGFPNSAEYVKLIKGHMYKVKVKFPNRYFGC